VSVREGKDRSLVRLAVWSGGQIEFESLAHLANTAERGLFDFVCLADGLGQSDPLTALAALSGVTERVGLVGTVDLTINEPFEIARQFATLDHLSGGRAGWNIPATSEVLPEFLEVARQFWDSWEPDAVVADDDTAIYIDPGRVHRVAHHGPNFDVRGMATLPAGRQGHPVLLHAGDTDCLGFGVAQADVLCTPHAALEPSRRYYADVAARAAAAGRGPERLKVFAVVHGLEQLGDTAAHVADEIDRYVQSDACDGFILADLTPRGIDQIVYSVVPILQARGVFHTEYRGATMREHLGLTAG
jgi:alkanesulfonate monooxygenase SsuD/methylene tetrahydromethanopterin reductase-like flavin-dependent oxidoreductase (luciferase family)